MDIGQAEIAALETVGEFRVIKAQQLQQGGVQVVDVDLVFGGVEAELVGLTDGDIKLEQVFCVGTGEWATEWERSVLGRNGQTLESDNAFIYRFEAGRIAEMWMFLGAQPELANRFFA